MRSALMLCPEAPYPMLGGGAIRTASLAAYLGTRYALDILTFREPDAPDPRPAIPSGLARTIDIIDLPRHGRGRIARSLRNAGRLARGVPPLNDRFSGFEENLAHRLRGRQYDVAVIEHFWCAPYALQVVPHARRLILDLHNIESALYASSARAERWPVSAAMRRFASACRALEREWLPRYNLLLAASDEDRARIRALSPGAVVAVYPNALPPTSTPCVEETESVAFSGNLEYHPNVAAVRFFRDEIWPALRRDHPQLIWKLIGRNEGAVRRYTDGDSRIVVCGAIDDAVKVLAGASVVVVPLLSGSGTRLKILEAWAAARPVVSTGIGAEGLRARDGENALIADSPAEFAKAVSRLLRNPLERRRLGAAGRKHLEENYLWGKAWEVLSTLGV